MEHPSSYCGFIVQDPNLRRGHTVKQAGSLTRIARNGGRWLLPWACILVVSGTIAFGWQQALAGGSLDWSAPSGIVAASISSGMLTSTEGTGMTPVAGSQWVLLW